MIDELFSSESSEHDSINLRNLENEEKEFTKE
jgi:hypothetical protein